MLRKIKSSCQDQPWQVANICKIIKKMQTGCPKMHRGKGTMACVRVCVTSRMRLRSVNSTRSRIRPSSCSSARKSSVIQMWTYTVRKSMIFSWVSVMLLTKYEIMLMFVHTDGSAHHTSIQKPVVKMNILTFLVLISYIFFLKKRNQDHLLIWSFLTPYTYRK